MIYAGIDPGATGALIIVTEDEFVFVKDYSEDWGSIRDALIKYKPKALAIERAIPMPRQSSISTASTFKNYGKWLGMLEALAIPYVEVDSKAWRKKVWPNMPTLPSTSKDMDKKTKDKVLRERRAILK